MPSFCSVMYKTLSGATEKIFASAQKSQCKLVARLTVLAKMSIHG